MNSQAKAVRLADARLGNDHCGRPLVGGLTARSQRQRRLQEDEVDFRLLIPN
jgi:hypothetical protein